jgi:hypothetical protein
MFACVLAIAPACGAETLAPRTQPIAAIAEQVRATANQIKQQASDAQPDVAALAALANAQVERTSRLIREFEVAASVDLVSDRAYALHEKADLLADLAALESSIIGGRPDWRWLRRTAKQQAGLAATL